MLWVRTRDSGACQPRRRVLREEGEFQIAPRARRPRRDRAAEGQAPRDRSHLSEASGPILVWVTSLIELGEPDIANGVLVNHAGFTENCAYRDALPDQGGLAGSEAHWLDEPDDKPEPDTGKPFWSGVDVDWSKWKISWCETDDNDEDGFVLARTTNRTASSKIRCGPVALSSTSPCSRCQHAHASCGASFACVVAVSVPMVPLPAASIPPGGRSAADRLRQGSWVLAEVVGFVLRDAGA